jgi:hypothetical protein
MLSKYGDETHVIADALKQIDPEAATNTDFQAGPKRINMPKSL